MALRSAADDFRHFLDLFPANQVFQLLGRFFAADQNDGVDRAAPLKSEDRVRDHRFAPQRGKKLVEPHPPAAPGCDNNCCYHLLPVPFTSLHLTEAAAALPGSMPCRPRLRQPWLAPPS